MTGHAISEVVILGAGNLGTHLARVFQADGIRILQVFDRHPSKGKKLANEIGCEFVFKQEKIFPGADLYILSVSDSSIETVASSFKPGDRLLVHCSGSVPMGILGPYTSRYGVFYPLQTFSAGKPVSFADTPLCVEANNSYSRRQLMELARKISGKVYRIDSEQRKILHLTAVFASNFTNFMYTVAEEILERHKIPFSLLEPIIEQTGSNAKGGSVFKNQSGPAVRGDHGVLEDHRKLLEQFPEFVEIYDIISKNIIKYKRLHDQL
jgi:predicted short-subunit dehydrogenase-like oxidoreductase (DUF2520 family)